MNPLSIPAPPPSTTPGRGWLLAATLAHLLLIVPFATGFIAWAYQTGRLPLRPAVYMIGMGLAGLAFTLPKLPVFSRTAVALLIFLFIRVADAAMQRWPNPDGWIDITFSLGATFFLTFVIACSCGVFLRVSMTPVLAASSLCVIICSLANVAEWLGFFIYSSVPGRAAGFIGDSNDSAIAIVCMMAVFLTASQKFLSSVIIIAVAGLGVFPTLSRSGFLVYGVTVMVWTVMNLRQHFTRIMLAAAAFITLGACLTGFMASRSQSTGELKDANVERRMSALFGGDIDKMESTERMKDLNDGWNAAMDKPLTGLGTGAGTRRWQPHNQFVSTWVDLGIFGAAAFMVIVLTITLKSVSCGFSGFLCTIPLLLFIPFSQTLVDASSYWYAAIMAATLTTARPLRFALRSGVPTPTQEYGYGTPA